MSLYLNLDLAWIFLVEPSISCFFIIIAYFCPSLLYLSVHTSSSPSSLLLLHLAYPGSAAGPVRVPGRNIVQSVVRLHIFTCVKYAIQKELVRKTVRIDLRSTAGPVRIPGDNIVQSDYTWVKSAILKIFSISEKQNESAGQNTYT